MSRASKIALGSWILSLAFGWVAGCAGPMKKAEVVPPGVLSPLSQDEGYLIIQIDTDVPLEEVSFKSGTVASGLPKGEHLWVLRLPARRYEWRRIDLGSEAGIQSSHLLKDIDIVHEGEFAFEVRPGIINYPGELIIRTHDYYRSSGRLSVRNRNHSAMAVRRLLETHPELLDAFSIRYAGWSKDGFLRFFAEQRHRIESKAGDTAR